MKRISVKGTHHTPFVTFSSAMVSLYPRAAFDGCRRLCSVLGASTWRANAGPFWKLSSCAAFQRKSLSSIFNRVLK